MRHCLPFPGLPACNLSCPCYLLSTLQACHTVDKTVRDCMKPWTAYQVLCGFSDMPPCLSLPASWKCYRCPLDHKTVPALSATAAASETHILTGSEGSLCNILRHAVALGPCRCNTSWCGCGQRLVPMPTWKPCPERPLSYLNCWMKTLLLTPFPGQPAFLFVSLLRHVAVSICRHGIAPQPDQVEILVRCTELAYSACCDDRYFMNLLRLHFTLLSAIAHGSYSSVLHVVVSQW